MRLVVLDTNVVVSAGIGLSSPPAELIAAVLDGLVQVVICPWVAGEYREVVRREKFVLYGFPPPWLEYVIQESLQLPDPPPWPHSLPDPKDAPFLALAKTAGAWLVTGNLKHFPKSSRHGVTVMSPRDYLIYLTEAQSRI
jgi:predicted nucleic acid-binding protein